MIFSWWNSQTLGTWLNTKLRGEPVGTDEFGNRYYQNSDGARRWVVYNGTVEASRVPPDWHGWMHHTYAEPPTRAPFKTKAFEAPHQPNLTGTDAAYRPGGSLQRGGASPPGHWRLSGVATRMSARMPQSTVETLTGAAVVIVAVLVLGFFTLHKGAGEGSGYQVNARLAKVDGLGVGTDVRISGIKVGSVSGLDLDPNNYLVTVHMNLRDDIKVSTDSSLLITSAGLLGTPYLSITPGGDDKMIVAGGFIENTQSANASDLMSLAGRFVSGQGEQK